MVPRRPGIGLPAGQTADPAPGPGGRSVTTLLSERERARRRLAGHRSGLPTFSLVFHLELRQFPHLARAFNLSREELDRRFARPWVTGTEIEYEDRRWSPGKATLIIYEGPELQPQDLGLGRGWATVGKQGREVTETVLAEAGRGAEGRSTLEVVKVAVRDAARTPLTLPDVIALVAAEYPGWRPSEQLAIAEQAVWELLHQRRLRLRGAEGPVGSERWPELLLSWESWAGPGQDQLVLEIS